MFKVLGELGEVRGVRVWNGGCLGEGVKGML